MTFCWPCQPWRYTTGSMEPVIGINKDVSGAWLLPMTISTYPVDWVCFCHLLKTQHCCLCPNGRYNPPLATHPPPPSTLAEIVIKHWLKECSSYTVYLACLQSSTRKPQWFQHFKVGNSWNTKCAIWNSICKSSHIIISTIEPSGIDKSVSDS